jgi:hypothetical protein
MRVVRIASLVALLAWACAGRGPAPVLDCEARGNARPICGFQNPEDLALLPDGHTLVVSEYGAIEGGRAGRLALFDLRSERRSVLFEGGAAAGSGERWGDPACPGSPSAKFSPHGIHLAKRGDGRIQLLVVQHGGRESIEFFELLQAGGGWRAVWRGCAIPPAGSWLNDVVALPGGGFLATHMMPRGDLSALFTTYEGPPPTTGHVLEWQHARGFRVVDGTRSSLPNGIELSADGSSIYLNAAGNGEVWRIERETGLVSGRVRAVGLDNSTWDAQGRLLVASLTAPNSEFAVCNALERGACPLAFQIVEIDPEALTTRVLYRGEGAPMGGGTVGLRVGDELFIGSYAGDRILRVKLD